MRSAAQTRHHTPLRLLGRPASPQRLVDDARMELTACRSEIEGFVCDVSPSLHRLEVMAYELGPAAHSEAIRAQALVARLARRTYG